MKKAILFVLVLSFFACQKKETPKEVKAPQPKCKSGKKLEMYQMSEMAALMEQMYVDNQRVKEHIKTGDTIGAFPKHYLNIYTAKFTDPTDNDLFFKVKAKEYIAAQQLLYSDTKNRKEHFNAGVDACVACHKGKCGGPLVRIKKLYIKE